MPPLASIESLKNCSNCSRRRIKCDRGIPECEKCLRKGLSCPGYGRRYRYRHQTITVHGKPWTTPPHYADNGGPVHDCVIASPSTPYAHDLNGIAWTQSKFLGSFEPEGEEFSPWCADGLSTGSQDLSQSSVGADKTMQSSTLAATRDEHHDCRRWYVSSPSEVLDANCRELLHHCTWTPCTNRSITPTNTLFASRVKYRSHHGFIGQRFQRIPKRAAAVCM